MLVLSILPGGDLIEEYIIPEYLYAASLLFAAITIVFVVLIFTHLHLKKTRFHRREKIYELLAECIGEALTEQTIVDIVNFDEIYACLKNEGNRNFVIANLINTRKNMTGNAADNIVTLYLRLGLRNDSLKKMQSSVWHKKAMGIYELYMMDQRDHVTEIFRHTNSKNEFVRMEAQTAIIGFSGFAGLIFLDDLTEPLNEWQQIKLLEQLASLHLVSMDHLPQWLHSSNEYVVIFALKLADIYQQYQVHDDVMRCLYSPNEQIRCTAVKTSARVAQEDTRKILTGKYDKETAGNKREILKQLAVTGTEDDIPFLLRIFNGEDELLQLEAGRTIATLSGRTFGILEAHAGRDEIKMEITSQIKYEQAR